MNTTQVLSLLQARVGSADFSKWQIHRWQFYDYVRYPAAGTTSLSLFQNATGSLDPNSSLQKTLEQTNLPKTGTFGQVYFIATQLRTHVHILPKARQHATILADDDLLATTIGDMTPKLVELFRRGVLLWSIGQKDYFDIERPFLTAPPGFGLEIFQNASFRTSQVIIAQQSPFLRDVFALTPAQMIEPEQNFTMSVQWDATSPVFTGLVDGVDPRIDIGVILDGYIARPSQ